MKHVDLDTLVAQVRELPLSSDGTLEAVIAACDDPDTPITEIATHVGRDPALAAVVLRQANSAALGRMRHTETIDEACIVLGVAALRTMAVTNGVMRFLSVDRDGLVPYRRALLAHSLATATAARGIARRAGIVPERAFLAGLVHDIGLIAMTRAARPLFLHGVVTSRTTGAPLPHVLKETLGYDDADLGARLADEWRLPPVLVDAIRAHREPAHARLERVLVETLHVADWVAEEAGHRLDVPGHREWPDLRAAESVGLNESTLDEFLAEPSATLATA